jgi:nitrite reductase (NADH) small subunit
MIWRRVTACTNIPPREGRAVTLAGREIAIFNLGPSTDLGAGPSTALGTSDRFLAVDNQCPHKAGPLADGIVTGTSVVCPLHTWKISLLDGRVERPSGSNHAGVTTYPTRVEEGVVVVAVPAAPSLDVARDGPERIEGPKPSGEGEPEVGAEADNMGLNIQDCHSVEPLLHERRLDPPCPYVDGCVSSNPGNPVV